MCAIVNTDNNLQAFLVKYISAAMRRQECDLLIMTYHNISIL